MSAEPDDAALLHAHVEGDPAAFGELVARHRDRLWAVALRTTGNPEEASDALQDALISAFRRADSFRGDSQVSTWLHRIVVNACLDRLRRAKTHATDPLPEADDRLAEIADAARIEDPAVVAERRSDVMAALSELPEEQRTAIVLIDLEGYSVDEVAALMDCPPGTIKSRCSRGRARLAPLLAQYRWNPAPPEDVQVTEPPNRQAGDPPPRHVTSDSASQPPDDPGSDS